MTFTIDLPEADVVALKAKAAVRGVSLEQYALHVLEQDLAPEWLRESWASARDTSLDQLSMDEIEAEIAAARQSRHEVILESRRALGLAEPRFSIEETSLCGSIKSSHDSYF